MTFAEKMFSFQGRMRRQDFWICTLILWAANIVFGIGLLMVGWGPLMELVAQAETLEQTEDPMVAMQLMAPLIPIFGVGFLFQIATIWPSLAICAKRLHDRNKSGWWVMLFVGANVLAVIPLIGILFSFGVFIWWLVDLGILDGTPGPNQFGPSPKALGHDEVFA